MLRHAYYWRVSTLTEAGEPPLQRYIERWGRPGDTALIAIQDFQPVGAAWYRLFKEDNPGYGFVDEATPELSIAIVPSRRGGGLGSELLDALLERARAEGHEAISLSVEKHSPAVGLYGAALAWCWRRFSRHPGRSALSADQSLPGATPNHHPRSSLIGKFAGV
jgi:GNAT superfamily N-acetyltransferase